MRSNLALTLRCLAAGALVAAGAQVVATPAEAAYPHPGVVSEQADEDTAQLVVTDAIPEPRVDTIAVVNGVVYIGGWFGQVKDDTATYDRTNIAALDERTGQVLPFSVTVDGRVDALVARRNAVYLGGRFTRVNGVARSNLAKVNAATGALNTRFRAPVDGNVQDLEIARGMLFVSGAFPARLVALRRDTGGDTRYLHLKIAGKIASSAGATAVYSFAVDPEGTRLVGVGNFTQVSGQDRMRAFMVKLGRNRAKLTPWYYRSLAKPCGSTQPRKLAYLQGVDFSPGGSYFVVVATGQVSRLKSEVGETVCDAAARFETGVADPRRPTWINYTGGDSVWGVAATGRAVYVQGHFRWLDNPEGRNSEGPGASRRPGIGAIHPKRGTALDWSPYKAAKVGGQAFAATPKGLWVGSDSHRFGLDPHLGLAFASLP